MYEFDTKRFWPGLLAVLFSVGIALSPALGDTKEEKAPQKKSAGETAKVEKEDVDPNDPSQAFKHIPLLTEVLVKVKNDYVEEHDFEKIIHGSINGMLTSLDPYSGFLDTKSYDSMKEETSGKFGGVGIRIGKRNGLLTVIAPIEDTPAYRAGLLAGDIIDKINGESTHGKTLKYAVDKLRGPKGESVEITILRRGEEEPVTVEIVRADIEVPTVKGARIIQDRIGYVRIIQFSEPTADLLQEKLEELLEEGLDGLIIDLRSNPGGLLRSAIDISSKFLPKDELIVTTKGRKSIYTKTSKSRGNHHYTDFPIAILVNQGSASASEIVAGALQDHGRAIVVGSVTFGKGSVQSIRPLQADPSTAIRMTTAYYYTPSEKLIHGKGIQPDIKVNVLPSEWRDVRIRRAHIENPDFYDQDVKDEYKKVVDRPLRRAVDLVKGLVIFQKAKKNK